MNITDGIAICKQCRKTFHKPLTGLEIGVAPSEQQVRGLVAFLAQLQDHMVKDHAALLQQLLGERDQFFGMRLVMQFNLHDANLEDQQDRLRWQIHQATLKHSLSDKNIAGVADQQANELAATFFDEHLDESKTVLTIPEYEALKVTVVTMFRERMMQMLTETRNALQEPGKYLVASNPTTIIATSTPN